mgnify:CR=1 FL=1
MSLAPLINGKTLRGAGREPAVPFRIALGDGRELIFRRLLRVLPGKRIVGDADLNGRRVLAKLFVAEASHRHWLKERAGIEALGVAGIATPELIGAEILAEGDADSEQNDGTMEPVASALFDEFAPDLPMPKR